MHDRHWKIHWMLNFAQLSATLNLRAVMEETHGKVDEVLLGRLQNSANDRNWDKIRALWEMKEEVKGDAELAQIFSADDRRRDRARPGGQRARPRFIDERIVPYQLEFGWHAVWSHEFVFPTFREDMNPVIQLVRDQYAVGLRLSDKAIGELRADIDAAAVEILEGLEGEALEKMRAANEINLKMAPLTPDHHFYIDQGANAHVRLVLIAIGEKLVEAGCAGQGRRRGHVPLQPAARLHRRSREHGRQGHRGRRLGQVARGREGPAQGLGRHRDRDAAGLPLPEPVGLPRQVPSLARRRSPAGQRHRRLAGRGRGHRPRGRLGGRVRQPAGGRDPRLPDDQPGLAGALRQDHRRGHRCRRHRLAPGGPGPRVRHPRRRRHLHRHLRHQDG